MPTGSGAGMPMDCIAARYGWTQPLTMQNYSCWPVLWSI